MTRLFRRAVSRFDIQWILRQHVALVRRLLRFVRSRLVASCTYLARPQRFRRLRMFSRQHSSIHATATAESTSPAPHPDSTSDLVVLKVCLLGDPHVGKTTFMERYVGDVEGQRMGLELEGLHLMEKNLSVGGGATWISFNIWDVAGDRGFVHHVPIACKDAGAILFLFDLTRRRTLNHVVYWYRQSTKWNQTAILIMVGAKFDDFAQLPLEMQWTIVNEARSYARAMGATLFFSSATHDINVNKIFKFIAARIFNLPWAPQRNLTVGEPIVDF